jgi:hypothetical protein
MNSTSDPKSTKDVLIAPADEQLARVGERIASAHEQIARVTEQLSKMEPDAARSPSAGPGPQRPRGRPAVRGLIGLLLAACIVVAGLVSQSSRDGLKLVVGRWAPQLVSTSSSRPKNPPFSAQPGQSFQQVATAEAAPAQAASLPQTGPQDAAPTAVGTSELMQLLQTMARDVANLERAIEQVKVKQDQIASDNSNAIEQLKAKQEDMARLLAKVSEQSAGPITPPPPAGPAPTASKPAPTQSPQVRARPPAPPRRQYPPPWRYYYEQW